MSDIYWFLETRNPDVNNFIGQELANQGKVEESWCRGQIGKDGREHDVWLVDYALIVKFFRSQFASEIRIYSRFGKNGLLDDKTAVVKKWLRPNKAKAKKAVEHMAK